MPLVKIGCGGRSNTVEIQCACSRSLPNNNPARPYELICEDTNLGFQRTNKLIFIQIFQQGRNAELKQAIYAEIQKRLEVECGVLGTNLIISCSANTKEDWSFGMGRAQFLTGDL